MGKLVAQIPNEDPERCVGSYALLNAVEKRCLSRCRCLHPQAEACAGRQMAYHRGKLQHYQQASGAAGGTCTNLLSCNPACSQIDTDALSQQVVERKERERLEKERDE
jgi:hypothetical protein